MYALKIKLLKQLMDSAEDFDGKSLDEFVAYLEKNTDIRLFKEEDGLPCYSFYAVTIPRDIDIVGKDTILQIWGRKRIDKNLNPINSFKFQETIETEIIYYENIIEGDVYE